MRQKFDFRVDTIRGLKFNGSLLCSGYNELKRGSFSNDERNDKEAVTWKQTLVPLNYFVIIYATLFELCNVGARLTGLVRATAELRIKRTKDLLLCAQVVITHANVVISCCCFAEDEIVLKSVPHVQHAYISFFHQSNSKFVALSLQHAFAWPMLKLPVDLIFSLIAQYGT